MNHNNHRAGAHEKNRVRDEIAAQIRDFLQRGGKIDVLTNGQGDKRNTIGSAWHSEEFADLNE